MTDGPSMSEPSVKGGRAFKTHLLVWLAWGLIGSALTSGLSAWSSQGPGGSFHYRLDVASVSMVIGIVPWCAMLLGWGLMLAIWGRFRRGGGSAGADSLAPLTFPLFAAGILLLLNHYAGGSASMAWVSCAAAFGLSSIVSKVERHLPRPYGRPVTACGVVALILHLGAGINLLLGGWFQFPSQRLAVRLADGVSRPLEIGPEAGRPNFVLVIMDTVRADHVSPYGYSSDTTPNLTRIAEESVLFEDATAPGIWTLPTHASMFTGMYESEHGLHLGHTWMEERFVTLAELLSDNGYLTVGVTGNPILVPSFANMAQGFACMLLSESLHVPRAMFDWPGALPVSGVLDWLGPLAENVHGRVFEDTLLGRLLVRWLLPGPTEWNRGRQDTGAAVANDLVREWLTARDQTVPFFLFLNYFEPHAPYNPPSPFRDRFLADALFERARRDYKRTWRGGMRPGHTRWRGRSLGLADPPYEPEDVLAMRQLYDGEIAYVDYRIGQLYEMLEEHGLLENTVLIVTADHGEQFLDEHGLIAHEFSIYESLLRVPLMVRFPRFAPRRVETPVQTIDLFKTVLWLAGIAPPADQPVRGSILPLEENMAYQPLIVSEYSVPNFPAFFLQENARHVDLRRYSRTFRAVRENGWKYIWCSDGAHELYHLAEDRGEQHNVIDGRPQRAADLRRKLDAWQATLDPFIAQEVGASDPLNARPRQDTLEQLRSLGYVQ